jgi:hypothetical protein
MMLGERNEQSAGQARPSLGLTSTIRRDRERL